MHNVTSINWENCLPISVASVTSSTFAFVYIQSLIIRNADEQSQSRELSHSKTEPVIFFLSFKCVCLINDFYRANESSKIEQRTTDCR